MIMKRVIVVFFIVYGFAATAFSQPFTVASTMGKVEYLHSGVWKSLKTNEKLTGKETVRIADNSVLRVIDHKVNKVHALSSHPAAPLEKIIQNQTTGIIGKFVDELITALLNGTTKTPSKSNVSYKSTGSDRLIYAALRDTAYQPAYAVSMQLIDKETKEEIKDFGHIGQKFFFRITNNANEPLFINVLYVSSDNSYDACFPIDSALTMIQFLTPAHSTVDYSEYPMNFDKPAGLDNLILIASPQPFDLRNIIELFKNQEIIPADNSSKIGVYKISITVK